MSLCKACISGVRHEGEATGTLENINGIECYVGRPTVEYPKNKVLLFLTDISSLGLLNNKLLVDDFAKNGFYTVLPDLFDGEYCPPNALNNKEFDLWGWFSRHGFDVSKPKVLKVVDGLKAQGFEIYGAVGYCYGGKLVSALAQDGIIKAGVMNHPSMLEFPTEMEKLKAAGIPILYNTCETDDMMGPEKQKIADEVFGDAEFYKRNYYAGASHGFSNRGDITNPAVKFAKEDAFQQGVEWLIRWL
ncbi:alpha/beta-hydrolase [Atractiella rhizophila]|nr:alpha/beta-hydrolase [Atractiella rhizophila]